MDLSTFMSWVYISKAVIWNFKAVCTILPHIFFFSDKSIFREKEEVREEVRETGMNLE